MQFFCMDEQVCCNQSTMISILAGCWCAFVRKGCICTDFEFKFPTTIHCTWGQDIPKLKKNTNSRSYFLIYLPRRELVIANDVASFGFDYGRNSVVKHAQAGVVLGWVTSRVLHLCDHHLDPMSAKCSTYSHERWIHVESLLMKYGSMSLTQKSHS